MIILYICVCVCVFVCVFKAGGWVNYLKMLKKRAETVQTDSPPSFLSLCTNTQVKVR